VFEGISSDIAGVGAPHVSAWPALCRSIGRERRQCATGQPLPKESRGLRVRPNPPALPNLFGTSSQAVDPEKDHGGGGGRWPTRCRAVAHCTLSHAARQSPASTHTSEATRGLLGARSRVPHPSTAGRTPRPAVAVAHYLSREAGCFEVGQCPFDRYEVEARVPRQPRRPRECAAAHLVHVQRQGEGDEALRWRQTALSTLLRRWASRDGAAPSEQWREWLMFALAG
jgi:hypothetical protein